MRAMCVAGVVSVLGAGGVPAVAAPTAGPVATASATVVTAGGPLNMRTGPSTLHATAGQLGNGARVTVTCRVYGQSIATPLRRTGYWDRLSNGRYVADAYLRWPSSRPALRWCGVGGAPVTPTVVTGTGPVNLRTGPGTAHRTVGQLANGDPLAVVCMAWGEQVSGVVTSHAWNLLTSGRYVADAVVAWRPSRPMVPWCGQEPPTVPAATTAGFIARVSAGARKGSREYGVPASVTIAQAILESGWGRSGLARRDHNYFGIKCHGSPGGIAVGCRSYSTHECGGGKCWKTVASFRAYRNPAGSMTDHGRFLVVNPRYRKAFQYSKDPNRFAAAIHKAGYATSPTYTTKLIDIMKRYDLYRFDR